MAFKVEIEITGLSKQKANPLTAAAPILSPV
jgi:hypothetical protein